MYILIAAANRVYKVIGEMVWFLLLVYLVTRLVNLLKFPLFVDEAFYIVRAEEVLEGASFWEPLKTATQPVFIWLIAVFRLVIANPILAARLASVFCGLVTMLILRKVAASWWGAAAGTLAAGLYIFLPLTLTYDRLALLDGPVAAFISLSLVEPLAGIPLAVLTKATGWLAVPLVGLFWLRKPDSKGLKKILLASLLPWGVWLVALGGGAIEKSIFKPGEHLSLTAQAVPNLFRIKLWSEVYVTWPLLLAVFLSGAKAGLKMLKRRKLTRSGGIAVWTMMAVVVSAAVGRDLYPRYLLPVSLGVILLVVEGIWWFKKRISRIVWWLVVAMIFFPLVKFDWLLLTRPTAAPLALEDRFQYFEDWTSGVGASELAAAVSRVAAGADGRVTVYLEGENSYYVALRADPRLRGVRVQTAKWLVDPLGEIPDEVFEAPGEVLFIRNRHPDIPPDWPVELLTSVRKSPSRQVFLYRVV